MVGAGASKGLSEAELRQLASLQGAQLEVGTDLAGLGEKAIDEERAALAACDAQAADELRRVVLAHYPEFISASQVVSCSSCLSVIRTW